jgi:thiosulfate/3-mercaptopyruvate sulfurtransferase
MGDTDKGREDFEKERIKGAVFFDIDEVADQTSPLPHMLPSPDEFAGHMTRLGLRAAAPLVVYNQPGCCSAARCWWTMKAFGHPQQVFVLNGGEGSCVVCVAGA